MNNRIIMVLVGVFCSILATGCTKNTNTMVYHNDVFTEAIYEKLTGIEFTASSVEYYIDDPEYLYEFYKELAALDLEAAEKPGSAALGFYNFFLCTAEDKIQVEIINNSLGVNGNYYAVDNDTLVKISDFLSEWMDR